MRSLRLAFVLGLAPALALGGCATAQAAKPAACDGKHRRPVNLHGSVLGDVRAAVPTPAKPAQPSVAPDPKAAQSKPPKLSAADVGPHWFPSC